MKEFIQTIWSGNKRFFIVTTLVLFVWMFFLDTNDIAYQYRLWAELNEIENEISYYEKKLKELEKESKAMVGSKPEMERIAREKFLMKKPSETIYILVDEDNVPIEGEIE